MSSDDDDDDMVVNPSGYHTIGIDEKIQLVQPHPHRDEIQLQTFRVQAIVLLAVSIACIFYARHDVTRIFAGLATITLFFTITVDTLLASGLRELQRPYSNQENLAQIKSLLNMTLYCFELGSVLTFITVISYVIDHSVVVVSVVLLFVAFIATVVFVVVVRMFAKVYKVERDALRLYRKKYNVLDGNV